MARTRTVHWACLQRPARLKESLRISWSRTDAHQACAVFSLHRLGHMDLRVRCADVCVRLCSTCLQQRRQRLEAQKAGCQQRSERVEDLVTDAEPRTRCAY